jgi:hypothetical protein
MPKTLRKVSKKSRPALRAARAKKVDKDTIFTKADRARQRKAIDAWLALPTVKVGDSKVSERGYFDTPPSSSE